MEMEEYFRTMRNLQSIVYEYDFWSNEKCHWKEVLVDSPVLRLDIQTVDRYFRSEDVHQIGVNNLSTCDE
ncbi:hypothetical protein WA026_021627 [Henosepilachna vigintioctopunctata]|uniref:Uncharacterized protein n=1 Tax=Henosepilachna vigintioctopunctata TaxID=420089 RepID=A0AAW1V2I6_9CUCU